MKRSFVLAFLIVTLLGACGSPVNPAPQPGSKTIMPPAPHTLTVFAASSLTEAFKDIGRNFELSHPGVTVIFNFAGSQTLRTQLEQGASADIFASANHSEMDTAVNDGLVGPQDPKDFITNKLIVILPPQNPASVQVLQDLGRHGLKLVLADATVPAGKYARQILDNLSKDPAYGSSFSTEVLANLVSNETDVKLVVAKVQLGEADVGIVYVSDAIATPELKTIAIPDRFNVIAKYPIAALAKSPNTDLAAAFIAFVLSTDGQDTMKKWGFTPVSLP